MNVIPGAEARATAAETFRRLYWDTALSWGDPVLLMLRDIVGIDRVVFGTEYPYLRCDLAASCREHIEPSPELTDSERTAVLGATAMTLIPRLTTLRPGLRPTHYDATGPILSPTARPGPRRATQPGAGGNGASRGGPRPSGVIRQFLDRNRLHPKRGCSPAGERYCVRLAERSRSSRARWTAAERSSAPSLA
jgi:Amidohydrolase